MPVTKLVTLPSGVEVRHWRISKVVISPQDKTMLITVAGYLSREAFLAGKEPVMEHQAWYQGDNYTSLINDTPGLKLGLKNLQDILEPTALIQIPQLEGATTD